MQNELIRNIWNEVIAKPHMSPAKVREIVERHLGKQEKPKSPTHFQLGKVYTTRFQTGEKFRIEMIKYKWDKDLGRNVPYYFTGYLLKDGEERACTLNVDRLI